MQFYQIIQHILNDHLSLFEEFIWSVCVCVCVLEKNGYTQKPHCSHSGNHTRVKHEEETLPGSQEGL